MIKKDVYKLIGFQMNNRLIVDSENFLFAII